jgi:hypothetical protein
MTDSSPFRLLLRSSNFFKQWINNWIWMLGFIPKLNIRLILNQYLWTLSLSLSLTHIYFYFIEKCFVIECLFLDLFIFFRKDSLLIGFYSIIFVSLDTPSKAHSVRMSKYTFNRLKNRIWGDFVISQIWGFSQRFLRRSKQTNTLNTHTHTHIHTHIL